jgi:hypothetical protein
LLWDKHLNDLFDEAMQEAAEGQWTDFRAVDQVINRLVSFEVAIPVQRSAGLCYGMQQIAYKPGLMEGARQVAVQFLIEGFDGRNLSESEPENG